MTNIVNTPLSKLVATKHIQGKILRTELPFHLYLNRGETGDRESFIKLSVEIDSLFDIVSKTEQLTPDDIELLQSSKDQWLLAKTLAETLLTINDIPENNILIDRVAHFGKHLERSASFLDEISALSLEDIQNIRAQAQVNEWKSMGLLMLVYGLGILLALLATLSLAQSIFEPIMKLKQSVLDFSAGNTGSRVTLTSDDELGSLGQAFNSLAAHFEQVQHDLNRLSTHDSLTGLADRRKLDKEIKLEIERTKRYNRTFSILLININNFSEVNETHGRLIGDSVLCSVANTIRNTIRPTDLAARCGGDEFAVMLSETNLRGAYYSSQRLFEAFENNALNIGDGKTLPISVSIGHANYPDNADSSTALFALAKKNRSHDRFNQKLKIQLL